MSVAPFPFASLPRVSRAEVAAMQTARALPASTFASALSALIDAEVRIVVRRARPVDRAAMSGVVAVFSPADGDALYVAEAETALAREVVMRALRQPPTRIADSTRAGSAELHGAFAAVVLAALRKTVAPPMRVVGVSAGAVEPTGTTAWLAVTVAGATFDARFTFPAWSAPSETRLDETPIALPLVAKTCLATRAELESLRIGDVFVPPQLSVVGPVALVAARSERGIAADLAEGGRLVIRTTAPSHHPFDMADPNAPLEAALDAPVVVRVELGAVEMSARAWAALADGDVITIGKKLGEHAVLRVGGVEVARGELVQVDGEYGIRVVGLGK